MLRQFASLSDDGLLQLVDCRGSSTLIDHLSKGTPNSVINWTKVQVVWEAHVRLDERDILMSSLIVPLVSGVVGKSRSSSSKAETLNI